MSGFYLLAAFLGRKYSNLKNCFYYTHNILSIKAAILTYLLLKYVNILWYVLEL